MQQVQAIQIVEHTLRTVLRTVLAIFFSAPIAGGAAAIAVEIIGGLNAHTFPAPTPVHVLALGFAIVIGYAAALTYAVVESIIGATRIARMLEQDIFRQGSLLERGVQTFERSFGGK